MHPPIESASETCRKAWNLLSPILSRIVGEDGNSLSQPILLVSPDYGSAGEPTPCRVEISFRRAECRAMRTRSNDARADLAAAADEIARSCGGWENIEQRIVVGQGGVLLKHKQGIPGLPTRPFPRYGALFTGDGPVTLMGTAGLQEPSSKDRVRKISGLAGRLADGEPRILRIDGSATGHGLSAQEELDLRVGALPGAKTVWAPRGGRPGWLNATIAEKSGDAVLLHCVRLGHDGAALWPLRPSQFVVLGKSLDSLVRNVDP